MSTLCNPSSISDLSIIKPEVPHLDGCSLFDKAHIFVVQQGLCPTLEWTFRDQQGNPVDLTSCFDESASVSLSGSVIPGDNNGVEARLDRVMKLNLTRPVILSGTVVDAATGVVRALLAPLAVASAGIFQLHWAIMDRTLNAPRLINRSLISVERSLFGADYGVGGPPTIQEIRTDIRDTSPEVNRLLRNVEFSDDEIVRAIVRPVEDWNDASPRLAAHVYDTITFPFRHAWNLAIQGYLLQMASHWYRRNRLAYQAGGLAVDDMDKEEGYMAHSKQLLEEWRVWLVHKKVELNAYGAMGEVSSPYAYN